jgi:hypothetical protein
MDIRLPYKKYNNLNVDTTIDVPNYSFSRKRRLVNKNNRNRNNNIFKSCVIGYTPQCTPQIKQNCNFRKQCQPFCLKPGNVYKTCTTNLNDLCDVSLHNVEPNDVLQYDPVKGKWVNNPGLWEVIQVPIFLTTLGQANPPLFNQIIDNGNNSIGVYAYGFDSGPDNVDVFFEVTLPGSYDEGTNFYPTCHLFYSIIANSIGRSGNIQLELEYSWANIGGIYTNTNIVSTTLFIPSGSENKHILFEFPPLDGTGMKIDSVLLCRLSRRNNNPTTVSPIFQGKIIITEIDWHYMQRGVGSNSEFIK